MTRSGWIISWSIGIVAENYIAPCTKWHSSSDVVGKEAVLSTSQFSGFIRYPFWWIVCPHQFMLFVKNAVSLRNDEVSLSPDLEELAEDCKMV